MNRDDVIGDKSSYRPCSYGDILSWQLPNTKIKGFVSHKLFNRPSLDKCEEDFIIPDVHLQADWKDIIEGKDIYWDWVLKNAVKIDMSY